jgi:Putative prokaryotic signal transducing protein
MRELLRSNDAVLISFAESLLREAGIGSLVADQHMSLMEGSIGAFPRRLLVAPDDCDVARKVLREAGLDSYLAGDGDARA